MPNANEVKLIHIVSVYSVRDVEWDDAEHLVYIGAEHLKALCLLVFWHSGTASVPRRNVPIKLCRTEVFH